MPCSNTRTYLSTRCIVCAIALILIVSVFSNNSKAALGDIITSFASPSAVSRGLAWDGSNLWHTDGLGLIYKIDPSSGAVLTSFGTGNGNSSDITFVGGTLWNADLFNGEFFSVDPSIGPPWNVEFTIFPDYYYGLTYDGSDLWMSNISAGTIEKRDLSGGFISSFAAPGGGGGGLTWDGTYLWNADQYTNTIYKIDPSTGVAVDSFSAPGSSPFGLTYDGQYLWHTDEISNIIYQIDAGNAPLGPTPAPQGAVSLAVMLTILSVIAGLRKLCSDNAQSV